MAVCNSAGGSRTIDRVSPSPRLQKQSALAPHYGKGKQKKHYRSTDKKTQKQKRCVEKKTRRVKRSMQAAQMAERMMLGLHWVIGLEFVSIVDSEKRERQVCHNTPCCDIRGAVAQHCDVALSRLRKHHICVRRKKTVSQRISLWIRTIELPDHRDFIRLQSKRDTSALETRPRSLFKNLLSTSHDDSQTSRTPSMRRVQSSRSGGISMLRCRACEAVRRRREVEVKEKRIPSPPCIVL